MATRRAAVVEFEKTLADMEETLSRTSWLAGDAYSLADVGMTPYVNRLSMPGMEGFWNARPRVVDWFARVRGRESFMPALIAAVPDELARSLAANGARSWPRVEAMLETVRASAARGQALRDSAPRGPVPQIALPTGKHYPARGAGRLLTRQPGAWPTTFAGRCNR